MMKATFAVFLYFANPTVNKSSFHYMESKHECFILYFLGDVMSCWGMCHQGTRVTSSYPPIQANRPISIQNSDLIGCQAWEKTKNKGNDFKVQG